MAGTARVLFVLMAALLVVSAGCVGLSGHSVPEELASLSGDPDNPYRSEELVVAVNTSDSERAFGPLVEEAVAYWEQNDERYLNYSVNFTLASNATGPALRIEFLSALERCGRIENAAGCAPRVTHPTQATSTVSIRVLDNLSAESTVRVLEHELGHALGLDHGDAPRGLMRTHAVLTTLPTPNATERAFAWNDSTLSVFVDYESASGERAAIREQVSHALSYYDRGAEGTVPKNVSFRLAKTPEQADVVVRFPEISPCGLGPGSCGSVFGADPDGDGALERYTRIEITLTGLDTNVVGWHVARWLAIGFGIETDSEYPPTLRETTSYEQRESNWWR